MAAQKFLSCVYRIREKSGFGVGIQHVVEVLCGADTEKVRKWRTTRSRPTAIGQEHSRTVGRPLAGNCAAGLPAAGRGQFNIVELTPEGRAILKARQKITLTRPWLLRSQPNTARRDRLRRGVVRETAAAPQATRRRAGGAALHHFLRRALRQMARFYRRLNRTSRASAAWARGSSASFGGVLWRNHRPPARQPGQVLPTTRSRRRRRSAPAPHGNRDGNAAYLSQANRLKKSPVRHFTEARFTAPGRRHRAGEAVELNRLLSAEGQREIAAAFERHGWGT